METLIAIIGWGSVLMIIYGCGNICDVIAMKLKFYNSSWYFWLAGVVLGFAIIAETDFPGYQNMGWTGEHVVAFKVIFTTWWLALLAVWGWGSAIYRISSSIVSDIKIKQQKRLRQKDAEQIT